MSNLVERLRSCLRFDSPNLSESELEQSAREAADEIERLRAKLDALLELLRFWSHEGRLQTFDDRERFRAMAAAVLKEKP